jgi:hypothetical protein
MRRFPQLQGMLALLRDGFHPASQGGSVALGDGAAMPVLDYPLDATMRDGARRALLTMAEIQFAAGADAVRPAHELAPRYTTWQRGAPGHRRPDAAGRRPARRQIRLGPRDGRLHDEWAAGAGVTGQDGRYHGLNNLSVHDGSLFPTSIGANPQLSIYASPRAWPAAWRRRLPDGPPRGRRRHDAACERAPPAAATGAGAAGRGRCWRSAGARGRWARRPGWPPASAWAAWRWCAWQSI